MSNLIAINLSNGNIVLFPLDKVYAIELGTNHTDGTIDLLIGHFDFQQKLKCTTTKAELARIRQRLEAL